MYCITIGRPHPNLGGGEKRTFELLKHFNEFEITPILYIPYSDLVSAIIIEEIYGLGKFIHALKELERSNVVVPSLIFENFEKCGSEIQHYLDNLQRHVHSIFPKIRELFQKFKINALFAEEFIRELIQDTKINPSKLEFVYSMQEHPSFVIVGAFLAKSLKKKLYVQLQLEPFKSLRKIIIDDWTLRVILGKQSIPRELLRLFLITLQSPFSNPYYGYSYALRNNLDGLLAVSEAPLVISGLSSWAYKNGLKTRVIRPGNAIEDEISKRYVEEKERHHLLCKKEDLAIYWARLRASKGLFEIPLIARKLAAEGYRLVIVGRFDHVIEKRIFFKLCEENKIKNVEYLGWLPRRDLFNVVSKSKVLIYPSHSDAFPLVTLEALFLGCSVVAYDIPAIRSVYRNLRPVKIVREYDCKTMVEEAIKILRRDISDHEEEHIDENFMSFLKMHSSWKNVAKADIEAIKEMMVC